MSTVLGQNRLFREVGTIRVLRSARGKGLLCHLSNGCPRESRHVARLYRQSEEAVVNLRPIPEWRRANAVTWTAGNGSLQRAVQVNGACSIGYMYVLANHDAASLASRTICLTGLFHFAQSNQCDARRGGNTMTSLQHEEEPAHQ